MSGRNLPFLLLTVFLWSAAEADDSSTVVVAAVERTFVGAEVGAVERTPVPGMYQVMVDGQVVYVSADGKYLMKGPMYDLVNRVDLTDLAMAGVRRDRLSAVPEDEKLVFAPDQPKHMVNVFTDLDCGYCKRLHSQVEQYNELGIGISYLFLPRGGLQSPAYDKAVSVWCADDRHQALTLANLGAEPEPLQCDNPIADHFNLALALGIGVTPTLLTEDGIVLSGYMPPEQLLHRLKSLDESADVQSRSAE